MKNFIIPATNKCEVVSDRVFSAMDKCCLNMVINGTWKYAQKLNEEVLKEGLALLLEEYPFLAGRMSGQDRIVCNNAGVPFIVLPEQSSAERNTSFKRVAERCKKFNIKGFLKGDEAPMSVILAQSEAGSSLTVYCAHVCFDGSSFYAMIRRWAEICREIAANQQSPSRAVIDQSLALSAGTMTKEQAVAQAEELRWVKLDGKKLIKMVLNQIVGSAERVKTLTVTNSEIESLKSQILEDGGAKCNIGLNALLSAYIIKRYYDKGNIPLSKKIELVTVADLRGRLHSIPQNFVGNAVGNIVTRDIDPAADLKEITLQIQNNVARYIADIDSCLEKTMQLSVEAFHYKLPFVAFDVAAMGGHRPTTLYINNQLCFHPEKIDFGVGLPLSVAPNDLPDMIKIWRGSADSDVQILSRM